MTAFPLRPAVLLAALLVASLGCSSQSKWQNRKVLGPIQEKPTPPPPDSKPDKAVFASFPAADRKAGSERFFPEGYVGVEGLGVAYEVAYEKGEKQWRLFVSIHTDDKVAASAHRLLTTRPATCLVAGKRVVGAMGLAPREKALEVLQTLAKKLGGKK